jgi:hypothetical protein
MKKCPYCAEEIQDEAIVCKHCGRDLLAVGAPPPAPTTIRNTVKVRQADWISTTAKWGCAIILLVITGACLIGLL